MPPPRLASLRRNASEAFVASLSKRISFSLLLVLALAAPFPWGSVQPGWTGTHKLLVLAFLSAAFAVAAPDANLALGKAWIPVGALAGIGVLGGVQLLPLPGPILRVLSPASLETWREAGKVLVAFGRTAPAPRISLAPWETAGVALLALAFASIFVAGAVTLDTRSRRRLFAVAVVASGILQLLIAFGTEDRLSRLRGSFVNPNNFAGYLLIPLSFAFGLVWYRVRYEGKKLIDAGFADARFKRMELLLPRVAGGIFLWGVLAAGLGMSQSRGGIVAAAGGTVLLIALAVLHRRKGGHRLGGLMAGGLAVAVAGGTVFALTATREIPFLRFLAQDTADLGHDGRVVIWRTSLKAFGLFPALGSGLGCFREAFRRVQPPDFTGLVDQAHDEYLQLLVTGGVIGALLGAVAIGSLLWILMDGFYRQPHREEAAWVLSSVGALLLLLLHGSVEFNFSIPATPATLAALAGGAWAAARWRHGAEAKSKPAPSPVSDADAAPL